jgi:uncharacterized protein (DUF1330 family)
LKYLSAALYGHLRWLIWPAPADLEKQVGDSDENALHRRIVGVGGASGRRCRHAGASCHAQAKPPAYVVAEIDVINAAPYDKEYVPPGAKAITDGGGKYIVRGGETTSFYGDPPKSRIAIMLFESMDKAKAAFDSPAFKAAKAIGDKYAKFRVYAVEGLPQ